MQIIWLDTETSGLDPNQNGIIEIGAIIGDGDHELNAICNPGAVMYHPDALRVNKIDMEDIREATPIKDVLIEFDQHVEDWATIAGHNVAGFDIPFLKAAYRRAGIKWRFGYHSIDTMVIAATLRYLGVLDVRSLSLGALADHFNIEQDQSHRALSDVKTTRILFGFLKRKMKEMR